jgi:hypothetical protein
VDFHAAYGRVVSAQSARAREFATATRNEHISYCAELTEIGAAAEAQWRKACETYAQELRAAAGGDDAIQRASVAYRNLQREYGRIQLEYLNACEVRGARMTDALAALRADATVKMLDGWIEHLSELRRASAGPEPASASGKKS